MNLYLIDATYELFRAFYGYPKRLSPKSIEIGAVRGLMEHVVRVRNNEENTFIAAAFDSEVISFRNDLYEGYKTGEEFFESMGRKAKPPMVKLYNEIKNSNTIAKELAINQHITLDELLKNKRLVYNPPIKDYSITSSKLKRLYKL